ncbi:MATE family efflux transporter [Campylobacter sp. VBCF_06 NA8]|uniref:MATE family efflux transporter n=1 Tax=Campylobacter sp. VBCF_06 NA8 TaxID=2983822 RepID=UPI0022E9D241|nr:MATE family efflux transporter [Campylobacter sp. VBCF_06 NA8]MDA3047088.1 MATE family efflux transporter [Campylobacter sp. VBCF_06 NA8]
MKEISLTKLSLAIYADMFLRLVTALINTYMISLVDVRLVGALGAGNQVFLLFITVFGFLAVGCSVVVAQALGARNKILALRAIHTSITFNALIGGLSGVFVFSCATLLLRALQVPSELLADSTIYLKIISIVFAIDAVAIVFSAIIRVYGYANYIIIISVTMNIITLVGNFIALFQPFGLPFYGLFGVGISTIIGRIVGVILFALIAVKIIKLKFYFSMFLKIKFEILRKILSVGLPSAGENLLWITQYLVAFAFVASMGEASLTVQTIYFQISSFIFFGGSAISMANEVIVGRLVGAKEPERAYSHTFHALKIGLIVTAFFIAVVFFARELIMSALNLGETHKEIMRPLFYLTIILELGRTFNIVFVNALRASGDARFPFLMGLIFMWGVSLPVGYFLGISLGIGILGVWIGFLCDEWLRGGANTWRWISKKWQSKRLV